jgi:hypothetical protein
LLESGCNRSIEIKDSLSMNLIDNNVLFTQVFDRESVSINGGGLLEIVNVPNDVLNYFQNLPSELENWILGYV